MAHAFPTVLPVHSTQDFGLRGGVQPVPSWKVPLERHLKSRQFGRDLVDPNDSDMDGHHNNGAVASSSGPCTLIRGPDNATSHRLQELDPPVYDAKADIEEVVDAQLHFFQQKYIDEYVPADVLVPLIREDALSNFAAQAASSGRPTIHGTGSYTKAQQLMRNTSTGPNKRRRRRPRHGNAALCIDRPSARYLVFSVASPQQGSGAASKQNQGDAHSGPGYWNQFVECICAPVASASDASHSSAAAAASNVPAPSPQGATASIKLGFEIFQLVQLHLSPFWTGGDAAGSSSHDDTVPPVAILAARTLHAVALVGLYHTRENGLELRNLQMLQWSSPSPLCCIAASPDVAYEICCLDDNGLLAVLDLSEIEDLEDGDTLKVVVQSTISFTDDTVDREQDADVATTSARQPQAGGRGDDRTFFACEYVGVCRQILVAEKQSIHQTHVSTRYCIFSTVAALPR